MFVQLSRSALADERTLQLGAVLSLTGPASRHGQAIKDGIEFAKKELNEKGWKVTVDYEDDETVPKLTISAVERLAAGGTRFFIGPTWSFLAEASAPAFVRSNSISLQPSNSSEFVHGGSDRLFFLLGRIKNSESVLTEWLKSRQIKSVAIIIATSTWGDLHREIFRNAALHAGAEVVLDESFQYGDENSAIPTLVTRLRTRMPNAILSTTSKEIVALLLSYLERQQVQTTMVSRELGDAVATKLTGKTSNMINGFSLVPRINPSFASRFKAGSGHTPIIYTDNAYDAVISLSMAAAAVGSDPERVKAFLEEQLDYPGASGRIKFDERHDVKGGEYEITEVVRRSE